MTRAAAQSMVSSKLLVLQSRRLMLKSVARRLEMREDGALRKRHHSLQAQVQTAEGNYRTAVFLYGSPARADYWIVAYSRLIGSANALAVSLRESERLIAPSDRLRLQEDIKLVDGLLADWGFGLRRAMSEQVA